jgi:hypothetical protein
VIDLYIADGGEPLWVTCVWLALKFLVVWLALRLPPMRGFLAIIVMVIASTIVLIGWEIIVPLPMALQPLLVLGVVVETAAKRPFSSGAFALRGAEGLRCCSLRTSSHSRFPWLPRCRATSTGRFAHSRFPRGRLG